MKITYIKLENFIGIYNGLGKYTFEVDFTKVDSDNNLVLLQGMNGCGKTTFLSCLHPFSGTMDIRTDIILPDHNGYKEIHFLHNDDEYIICHNYLNKRKNKVIKSYIQKNGEELNDNGTVKSFEEIVERELDVTPSFFVLSRIGSNVKNFIGLKPAERKNYMSKFLPDVSQYLFEYKKINEKFLNINKKIKSVTMEINKLDDEESLKARKVNLTKNIKSYNKIIDDLKARINKNKGILSTLNIDEINTKYNESLLKIEKSETNIDILEENFDDIIDSLSSYDINNFESINDDDLNEIIINLTSSNNDKLIKAEKNLTKALEKNKNLKENLEKEKSELEHAETELKSYKLDKDLDEFKEMKEEYNNSININEKHMNTFEERYKLDINDESVNILQQFLNHIKEDKLFFTSLDIMDKFIDGDYINKSKEELERSYTVLRSNKESLEEDIKELNSKISFLQSKLPLNKLLDNRPKTCKDDSCKFIAEAVKYKDVNKNIEKNEELLKEKENKLKKIKEKMDNLADIHQCREDFFRVFREIKSFSSYDLLIKLFPDYFSNKEDFLKFIRMDKTILIDDFKKALDYSHYFMDFNESTNLLKEIEVNIKILESKDELINKTKKEISKRKANIEEYEDDIKEINEKISKNTEIKEKYSTIVEYLEELNKIKTTYDKAILINTKYTKLRDNLSEDFKKIKDLNEKIDEYEEDLEVNEKYNTALESELDDVKYNIKRLSEFKKELDYLDERSKNVEIVRKALSPTKGIPLLFIDVYLKKTKNIANELLDIAYDGKFYIEDFELTDNDFFIKVIKEDGILVKDVTDTSQGEMSLIGLAISLAIIQQSEKKYNIILIDEMDKELDESNRRAFVDILEKQLDILNVEQSFIISHNKEFDTANLDLILFKGHNIDINSKEFMQGKNIIYK